MARVLTFVRPQRPQEETFTDRIDKRIDQAYQYADEMEAYRIALALKSERLEYIIDPEIDDWPER